MGFGVREPSKFVGVQVTKATGDHVKNLMRTVELNSDARIATIKS